MERLIDYNPCLGKILSYMPWKKRKKGNALGQLQGKKDSWERLVEKLMVNLVVVVGSPNKLISCDKCTTRHRNEKVPLFAKFEVDTFHTFYSTYRPC